MQRLRIPPPQIERSRRSLVAALLLPVLLAGGVGLPAVPVVRKDLSQPFPCQDCACACRDAQACWSGCCCLTDEQKLAWAKAHNVTPPAYVAVRAANESSHGFHQATAHCSHCKRNEPSTASNKSQANSSSTTAFRLVLVEAQRRCQGAGFLTMQLTAATPCRPAATWRPEFASAAVSPLGAPHLGSPSYQPPDPPPRSRMRLSAIA
ncbi:MAG: hypothetical protein RIC55_06985 [Pirellulaceae bacterium]